MYEKFKELKFIGGREKYTKAKYLILSYFKLSALLITLLYFGFTLLNFIYSRIDNDINTLHVGSINILHERTVNIDDNFIFCTGKCQNKEIKREIPNVFVITSNTLKDQLVPRRLTASDATEKNTEAVAKNDSAEKAKESRLGNEKVSFHIEQKNLPRSGSAKRINGAGGVKSKLGSQRRSFSVVIDIGLTRKTEKDSEKSEKKTEKEVSARRDVKNMLRRKKKRANEKSSNENNIEESENLNDKLILVAKLLNEILAINREKKEIEQWKSHRRHNAEGLLQKGEKGVVGSSGSSQRNQHIKNIKQSKNIYINRINKSYKKNNQSSIVYKKTQVPVTEGYSDPFIQGNEKDLRELLSGGARNSTNLETPVYLVSPLLANVSSGDFQESSATPSTIQAKRFRSPEKLLLHEPIQHAEVPKKKFQYNKQTLLSSQKVDTKAASYVQMQQKEVQTLGMQSNATGMQKDGMHMQLAEQPLAAIPVAISSNSPAPPPAPAIYLNIIIPRSRFYGRRKHRMTRKKATKNTSEDNMKEEAQKQENEEKHEEKNISDGISINTEKYNEASNESNATDDYINVKRTSKKKNNKTIVQNDNTSEDNSTFLSEKKRYESHRGSRRRHSEELDELEAKNDKSKKSKKVVRKRKLKTSKKKKGRETVDNEIKHSEDQEDIGVDREHEETDVKRESNLGYKNDESITGFANLSSGIEKDFAVGIMNIRGNSSNDLIPENHHNFEEQSRKKQNIINNVDDKYGVAKRVSETHGENDTESNRSKTLIYGFETKKPKRKKKRGRKRDYTNVEVSSRFQSDGYIDSNIAEMHAE